MCQAVGVSGVCGSPADGGDRAGVLLEHHCTGGPCSQLLHLTQNSGAHINAPITPILKAAKQSDLMQ